jgi:2-phospho-L-lactate transferase/gluconeogenesis factor (CofD/UPF0052 family)
MTDQNQELQTELTISDLRAIANIIDHAASKGAYRASDFAAIGGVYNKIMAVLGKVKNEV